MIRINLVPRDERGKSRQKVNWNRMGAIIAASVTIVVIALGVFNYVLVGVYKDQADALAAEVAVLQREQATLTGLRRDNNAVQADIDSVMAMYNRDVNERLLHTLKQVADVTPDGVWLTRMQLTPDQTAYMSGYALRAGDFSLFLEYLESVPQVARTDLPLFQRRGEGSSRLQMFSLDVTLNGGAEQ